MSDSACKHCGKTKEYHLAYFECPRPYRTFTPVEQPPAPFKVGDVVVNIHYAYIRGRVASVKRETECAWRINYVRKDRDEDSWDWSSNLRLATPEEVRAVTHFTPKVGMILQEKSNQKAAWIVQDVTALWCWLGGLPNIGSHGYSVSHSYGVDSFYRADWTIMDKYTITGVTE